MVKSIQLILLSLFWVSTSIPVFALKSDGKVHVKDSAKTFDLKVDEGFHFNIQSPTFLRLGTEKISAKIKTEKYLQFQKPAKIGTDDQIQTYVCDNAKTVCESFIYKLKNTEQKTPSSPTPSSLSNPLRSRFEEALAQAKSRNSLLLLDFTASWCPACIRLTRESFPKLNHKKLDPRISFLILDVDKIENQDLLVKYHVKAFPTLVLVNSSGAEVGRILDYLPPVILEKQLLEYANQSSHESVDQLMAAAMKGDPYKKQTLAMHYFKSLEYTEAIKWFSESKYFPIEYHQSMISLAEENFATNKSEQNRQSLTTSYQQSLKAFPNSFYALEWSIQWINLLKESNNNEWKQMAEKAIQSGEAWINDPSRISATLNKGEVAELGSLMLPEIYSSLSQLYEIINNKEKATHHAELAIATTLKLQPDSENPTLIIYLVNYLKKTRKIDEITPWLEKLQKAYPTEFTYYHREANLLLEMGFAKKALPFAEKANNLSYGSNQFRTTLTLAKVHKALKSKNKARDLIDKLVTSNLAKIPANEKQVQKLLALRTQLSSSDNESN